MKNNNKYDCPHCEFDHKYREVERGKVKAKGNPFNTNEVVDIKNCPACDGTGYLHQDIVESLEKYCKQHNIDIDDLIRLLKNGSDHFYFWQNNIYHGVEFVKEHRGYIHT